MDERDALVIAVEAARTSPCQKSKRGVVIWRRGGGILSTGFNHPAHGTCDGSESCRRDCSKTCIHAEQDAMWEASRYGKAIQDVEMLHVKVIDGNPVPSGPPSCWQCSKMLVNSGIKAMWLLEEVDGEPTLKQYTTLGFHRLTLINCGLHPHGPDIEPMSPKG